MERLFNLPGAMNLTISRTVAEYAKDHGLAFDAMHQDEPIWYVSIDEPRREWLLTRYVQIISSVDEQSDKGPQLKATPGARAVNEQKHIARVLQKVPPSLSTVISTQSKSEVIESTVNALLDKSWESAKLLDPWHIEDFVEEQLPA